MTQEVIKEAVKVTPGIEEKVVGMLDALQNGAVKIGEQVVKYSPDVADAALWVVRIDGVQSIATAIFFVIAAIVLYVATRRFWAWAWRVDKDFDTPAIMVPVVTGILTIISSILASARIFDVWNWIAIFQPKLYLAKQIIKAAIN